MKVGVGATEDFWILKGDTEGGLKRDQFNLFQDLTWKETSVIEINLRKGKQFKG